MSIPGTPSNDNIIANFNALINTVNINNQVFTQRLEVIMEVLEELHPGIIDAYTKRMFKKDVMATLMSLHKAREDGGVDVLQALNHHNGVLSRLKEEAVEKDKELEMAGSDPGWVDVYDAAKREVEHTKEVVPPRLDNKYNEHIDGWEEPE